MHACAQRPRAPTCIAHLKYNKTFITRSKTNKKFTHSSNNQMSAPTTHLKANLHIDTKYIYTS